MDDSARQLQLDLRDAIVRSLSLRRPLLHHLNADTSWLLQIPRPAIATKRSGRYWFNVLIDPWLRGSQSEVASWFSEQWHAEAPSVGSIAGVEELAREIEILSGELRLGLGRQPNGVKNGASIETFIDAVAISHEFTDHCHKETLLEVHPDVPVIATKKAANVVRGFKHFRYVLETPVFSEELSDWRVTSLSPLPNWLGIGRLVSDKDVLNYHSALLFVFNSTQGATDSDDDQAEAVIYTPHGISASALSIIGHASPPINTLAFLHGLHDIKIGSQQRLNLGAHNGLSAQRVLGARYWIGTHDEVKKGGGFVSWFLNRKTITVQEALEEEAGRSGTASGKPVHNYEQSSEIKFLDLRNGESVILA